MIQIQHPVSFIGVKAGAAIGASIITRLFPFRDLVFKFSMRFSIRKAQEAMPAKQNHHLRFGAFTLIGN
jgi:hypothetical protein